MPALLLALLLAACGSSNPPASTGPTGSGASAGDDVATAPPQDESAQDEPLEPAAEPAQDCYVIEVNEQPGCWASAEEACASSGCAEGACICTEAGSHNTCGC